MVWEAMRESDFMEGTKDNLVKVKRLAVLNLVLTAVVLVLNLLVIPNLFWIENPDGDYTYETVEDTIETVIIPVVINVILSLNILVLRIGSDKLEACKKCISVSLIGILVNIFQAGLGVYTAVTHFDRMSLDGGKVSQSYVYINSVFLIVGMISVGMVFVYGLLIKLSLTKKESK